MASFSLPADYPRIRQVSTFEELVTTPLDQGINALCWARAIPEGFREVVEQLDIRSGIASLDDSTLLGLNTGASGREAIDFLLRDLQLFRERDLSPVLECVESYPRDEGGGAVLTDVYSFHADSAPVQTETYLCTYLGPATEGLRNDQAERQIDIPKNRARLLGEFGGEPGAGFMEFLRDHCYDLHYAPMAGAVPFSFGQGNLWRIAVEYPGSPVPACIHRAPDVPGGGLPRLLLIS